MFSFYGARGGGIFDANYRVYPVSFIDKLDAENGDKIFLPSSALDRLASLHVEYPMLFRLENRKNGRSTHSGVLEFIADEGMLYMPYWMMQNLVMEEGDIMSIRSATLPKGTYVKLQPHTQDFLDITNPKAVLETTLRGFSCLTTGDTICLPYNNKKYFIDVVEARPQGAISVIETDCEVDFAPPLDYVEPARQTAEAPMDMDSEAGPSQAPEEPEEPQFKPFVGSGRRLDGKPSNPAATAAAPPGPSTRPTASTTGRAAADGTGTSTSANGTAKKKVAGKVVFGGGNRLLEKKAAEQQQKAGGAPPPPPKKQDQEPKEDEGEQFKAFTGKPRTLKG